MTPSHPKVACETQWAVTQMTRPVSSKKVPCMRCVGLPVVIGSCLLLAHLCWALTLRLAESEAQHSSQPALEWLITLDGILCRVWGLPIYCLQSLLDFALLFSEADH